MKVWTKVHLKNRSKRVELISASLTNYIYGYGPMNSICKKYKITEEDRKTLEQYTANRVAGLLMLYLAHDTSRINDILNKYNISENAIEEIIPEIEGYIEK